MIPPGNGEEWTPLFDLDDPVDAAAAKSALAQAGLRAEIVPSPYPGRPARRELWVPRAEAEQAMRLVGEYAVPEKREAPPSEPELAPGGRSAAVHVTGLLAFSWIVLFAPVVNAPPEVARDRLLALGAVQPVRVFAGEWCRLWAAQLLHHDLPHLLGNLAFLVFLAPSFARRFGAWRAPFVAFTGGAVGFLLSAWWLPPQGMSVGASATIFAILGALAADRIRHARSGAWPGKALLKLGGAAVALALFRDENTDVAAHAGSLLVGGLLALLVRPPGASPSLVSRLASAALGLGAVATVLLCAAQGLIRLRALLG